MCLIPQIQFFCSGPKVFSATIEFPLLREMQLQRSNFFLKFVETNQYFRTVRMSYQIIFAHAVRCIFKVIGYQTLGGNWFENAINAYWNGLWQLADASESFFLNKIPFLNPHWHNMILQLYFDSSGLNMKSSWQVTVYAFFLAR